LYLKEFVAVKLCNVKLEGLCLEDGVQTTFGDCAAVIGWLQYRLSYSYCALHVTSISADTTNIAVVFWKECALV